MRAARGRIGAIGLILCAAGLLHGLPLAPGRGGSAHPAGVTEPQPIEDPAFQAQDVAPGAGLYAANCAFCHGVPGFDNGGAVPNLAQSSRETMEALPALVLDGAWQASGKPPFAGRLTPAEVEKIRAFVLSTSVAMSSR